MNAFADCTVAILTARGRGAVASINVTGQASPQLIDCFFKTRWRRSVAASPCGCILFGHWQRATGNLHASEEVIVCRKNETQCEVHCHGGRAAAAAIVADMVAHGATEIDWREWIRRTSANVLQAEALWALAEAPTQRCADVLLDQHHGALRRALDELQSYVEQKNLGHATQLLAELLSRARYGLHLTRPFRVALVGRPNVGKSSLINRLLGYERSIVFDQPGTTRDVVSAMTAFDGWPVELLDTAGLRDTTDPIEVVGAEYARRTAADADLVLLVAEPSNVMSAVSFAVNKDVLCVLNKIDRWPVNSEILQGWLPTCALTGEGISQLVKAMVEKLVPYPPQDGDPVPFTERQHELLAIAWIELERENYIQATSALRELAEP
jgi:tRNA modification GTPase